MSYFEDDDGGFDVPNQSAVGTRSFLEAIAPRTELFIRAKHSEIFSIRL